jgi:hypothetical protein
MGNEVKRTERGWAGHFCGSHNCLFHRNTLLECNDIKIVISTVGLWKPFDNFEKLGPTHYFETMAFVANDSKYKDAIINNPISFSSQWKIDKLNDIEANNMHEKVIEELTIKLQRKEKLNGR